MHLAIDPGTTTGWALFTSGDRRLAMCGLNQPEEPAPITSVTIERPRIYPHGRTKNPNDVLSVAINAGEWAGRYKALGVPVVRYVEPATWKGQVPKDVHHARIWSRLSANEQEIVSVCGRGMPPSKRHNMLDAVGLGLWAVGRKA